MSYAEKLLDPRWIAKRQEILERDEYECQRCRTNTETLNVHHLRYDGYCDPWNYENEDLITLCRSCHEAVGIQTPKKEIVNPWLVYERMKKELPVMSSREYSHSILVLSNTLSL